MLLRKGLSYAMPRQQSTIAVLFTGSRESALEPVPAELPPAPIGPTKVLEGRGARIKAQSDYLTRASHSCKVAGSEDTSPLYLGLRRAIEQVRAVGGPGDRRRVLAAVDLQETAYEELRNVLAGRLPLTRVDSIPKLRNEGVHVFICGYASTRGATSSASGAETSFTADRSIRRVERLTKIWQALFAEPSRVRFSPFCISGSEQSGAEP